MKILITGYGVISAIGIGEEDTVKSLRNENSGISKGKQAHKVFRTGNAENSSHLTDEGGADQNGAAETVSEEQNQTEQPA